MLIISHIFYFYLHLGKMEYSSFFILNLSKKCPIFREYKYTEMNSINFMHQLFVHLDQY